MPKRLNHLLALAILMRFELWEPLYQDILEDFGFSRDRDEEAARLLWHLLKKDPKSLDLDRLDVLIRGRKVLVCGNAPGLARVLEKIRSLEDFGSMTVIAADGATSVLLKAEVHPHIIVSDLDGYVPDVIEAEKNGSIVVVHAHGDNMPALKEYVPLLKAVVGTTQSEPFEGIYNFGGFTDGDRCVFLARRFGAATIKLIGFDYEDPLVTPMKKKKLKWARRLVEMALTLSKTKT